MFVLLKNTSLKNIRTHINSSSVMFCYIVDFENFATKIRNLLKENSLAHFKPNSNKRSRHPKY